MKKNVAVLLTKYQVDFFSKVKKVESLTNVYLIMPKEIAPYADGLANPGNCYVYDFKRGHVSLSPARRLIKGVKAAVVKLDINKEDSLWIANDDNPVVQCVNSIVGFQVVNFIEDGLGSYVESSFFDYKRGLISVMIKLKKFIYFFPYYRSFYSIGGGIKGLVGYSYYESAYPMQPNIVRKTIDRGYNLVDIEGLAGYNSAIFIGQPLVNERRVRFSDYVNCIKFVESSLERGKVIYVPHPRETEVWMLESEGINVVFNKGVPVEDYVYSSGKGLRVYGFYSTALINLKHLENVEKVVALRPPGGDTSDSIERVLLKFGIHIINSGS